MKRQRLDEITEWLEGYDLNSKQIEFIVKQIIDYEEISKYDHFDYDSYERDMWYTMNRSGLFEKDDEENKSDINNWTPIETRHYITEIRL